MSKEARGALSAITAVSLLIALLLFAFSPGWIALAVFSGIAAVSGWLLVRDTYSG